MSSFRFDFIPVELLHKIFDHLSANDILLAFLNINNYLNDVLTSYDRFRLNFRACRKHHFNLLCTHIQPHQVLSLILSNSDDTPDQLQLFFSLFAMKQFTRLRSITLIDMEKHVLLKLIDILNNDKKIFQSLQAFRILPGYCSETTLPEGILTKFCSRPLRRLEVYNTNCLNIQSLHSLRHLTVHEDCQIDQFQQILSSMLRLVSLQVTNHTDERWIQVKEVPSRLKRLVLHFDIRFTLIDLEDFLRKLTNLKHLELQIQGDLFDLCDGQRWSVLTEHLLTFDFNFTTENGIIIRPNLLIDSFRSLFWIEHKRWFVTYDDQPCRVFTVPRFAPTSAVYNATCSLSIPSHTTADRSLFFNSIHHLTISDHFSQSSYFPHVTILSLSNLKFLEQLQYNMDFTQIKCLKVSELVRMSDLERYIPSKLPHVDQLHLRTLSINSQQRSIGFEQIRSLRIQTLDENASRLYKQFPCIQFLHLERVKSDRQVSSLLNDSPSHLSFMIFSWMFDSQAHQSFELVQNWLKQKSVRRGASSKFTYRSYTRSFPTIHLWIDNQTEQLSTWSGRLLNHLSSLFHKHNIVERIK